MKLFLCLLVLFCLTFQEELKNIEDVEFDPLFTVVKKNKKKLKKNSKVLLAKDKSLKQSQKFVKPPKRNLQVYQTDEDGKLMNSSISQPAVNTQKPSNRKLANQNGQKIQRKSLEDFQRLMTMAQEFKKDRYFKVKVAVKYHPEKQLQKRSNQPVKRKLRQIKEDKQQKQKRIIRRKMDIPKNFYLQFN